MVDYDIVSRIFIQNILIYLFLLSNINKLKILVYSIKELVNYPDRKSDRNIIKYFFEHFMNVN